MRRRVPALLSLVIAAHLATQGVAIAADSDLDAVLQGFDAPAGENDPALDAVLGVFDADEGSSSRTERVAVSASPLQLSGTLALGAAYNYAHEAPSTGESDYRGLSRLRTKLNLELDYDFSESWRAHLAGHGYYDALYALRGRDEYSDEVIAAYEGEAELGEAWLQGKVTRQADIKLGRQIVVWGKSDNIRVTDVINPLDNREPGMVDIEDLRLPLAMARLDYYLGNWGVTALAIPEILFNKLPPYGSDFYPYTTPMPTEKIPEDGGNSTEYALAANGIFSGWDLSLYWAQLFDDTPHLTMNAGSPRLLHSRLTMTGIAANMVIDNFLLKAEAARFSGIEYGSAPGDVFSRSDTLLGIEYSGFRDTTVSLEVANRHLHDYTRALLNEGVKEDEWQTALRYQGDFMHARLHLLALVTAFGKELDEGGFGRYAATYDLADALSVTAGLISFEGGEKIPFSAYGDNDRLFIDLKYSF